MVLVGCSVCIARDGPAKVCSSLSRRRNRTHAACLRTLSIHPLPEAKLFFLLGLLEAKLEQCQLSVRDGILAHGRPPTKKGGKEEDKLLGCS